MTDDFDDAIRARVQPPAPGSATPAHVVLNGLRPAMRRARLLRGLAVGAASLAGLSVTGLGIVAAANSIAQEPAQLDVPFDSFPMVETVPTTPPTTASTSESSDDERLVSTPDEPVTDADTSTNDVVDSTTTTPTTVQPPPIQPDDSAIIQPAATTPAQPTSATTISPRTTPPTIPPTSTPASTPDTSPTTTAAPTPTTTAAVPTTTAPAPTTTAASTTIPPGPEQRTIQSDCGSITVSYTVTNISLAGVQTDSGFSHDTLNSGPQQVVVRFDDGDDEGCEIAAWIDGGTLRTDIDNDVDTDDGDDGDDDDG